MKEDRRNPYVLLGVPFGISQSEARVGFARARRRILQNPAARYNSEDLTWALHQIEQILEDPHLALDVYRVPADPDVLQARTDIGVFNPTSHLLARRTPTTTEADILRLRNHAIRQHLRSLILTHGVAGPIPYEDTEEAK